MLSLIVRSVHQSMASLQQAVVALEALDQLMIKSLQIPLVFLTEGSLDCAL